MKKKIRKLSLTKETLRGLEESKLTEAAGGATEPILSCEGTCTNATRKCSVCCF
jgi:natural product precursor